MDKKKLILALALLQPAWLCVSPARAQVALSPAPAFLSPGTTVGLDVSVNVGTSPLGGYLYKLSFDTRTLTLNSIAPAGPLSEFFIPTSTPATEPFLGLNPASLTSPSGSVPLAHVVFGISSDPSLFAGGAVFQTTVTVTPMDSLGTAAQPLPVAGAQLVYQVAIDTIAPVTTIVFAPPSTASDPQGRPVLSTGVLVSLAAVDPLSSGFAAGVAATFFLVDQSSAAMAFSQYISPFRLSVGSHTILWSSRDNAGNVEVVRSTQVTVGSQDTTPPVTSLTVSGPQFADATGQLFAATTTLFGFFAVDPSSGGVPPSGVARTEFRVDAATPTAPFQLFVSSFTLPEGGHVIDFRSVDKAGNVEVAKSSSVKVDATAPITSVAFSTPPFVDSSSRTFIGGNTTVGFTAQDPVSNGVASGVAFTEFRVDAATPTAAFARFVSTFTLPEGVHALDARSADNVGNRESVKTFILRVDATPPITKIVFSTQPFVDASSRTYVAGATSIGFSASDPVSSGVASGLAFTEFRVDAATTGANFQRFVSTFSLAEGLHLIEFRSRDNAGNVEATQGFTLRVDTTPPVTQTAFSAPPFVDASSRTFIAGGASVGFAAQDPVSNGVASGVAFTQYRVDAATSAPFSRFSSTFSLAEGLHSLDAFSLDNVGNAEAVKTFAVRVDTTAPVSSVLVGSPQFVLPDGSVLVGAQTPLLIVSTDPVSHGVASGLKDSFIAFDTGVFSVSAATFTVPGPDGTHSLSFYSRDNVLNVEAVKVSTFVLDSTPPQAVILCPGGAGLCDDVKGRVPVLGTVADLHLRDWRLEAALGQNATTGYVLISSGTTAVSSGTLGLWDASSLSGWQTLRLTATDLVLNVSVVSTNAFVGDPSLILALGGKKAFNKPDGVAVGSTGNIYIADTNNDRVSVFTSTGGLLASFGRKDGDRDDDSKNNALKLNRPRDVKADAGGNIYVADTNNNRVVKLSPTGQLLLQIPAAKKSDDNQDQQGQRGQNDDGRRQHDARGSGQFNAPHGLALDGQGAIYVADTNNHRVQVFGADGTFLRGFDLPAVPANAQERDEDEQGDADQSPLGKPFGITLDGAGNIYVADGAGDRALVFSATGTLLASFGTPGRAVGQLKEPHGIAVSPDGLCLFVSDRDNDRVQKFDFQGHVTLFFGTTGQEDDDHPKTGITFNKPVGLALDPGGNLFVADRNDNRIEKFGLPAGQAAVVVTGSAPVAKSTGTVKGMITKKDGGRLERADKAAVVIPAGALGSDIEISIATPTLRSDLEESVKARKRQQAGLVTVSTGVEYGPEGTTFSAPVTLVLPYDQNTVLASGLHELDLRAYYWNRDKQDWEPLSSVVDVTNHVVNAQTTHFSLYQVLGPQPQGGSAGGAAPAALTADPTFAFHDLYAFPNPSRGSQRPTIRIQVGLADEVTINIYDISGDLKRRDSFGSPAILDDGNGKGPQYTYDYTWDAGGAGSGVYIYVVTAKKGGAPPIRRTGRVGVIR